MNYIQLWTLPSYVQTEDGGSRPQLLVNNILEMAMCRAFQMLPGSTLQRFFGDQNNYTGCGLNILPPLFQGIKLPWTTLDTFTNELLDSPDPKIREFPKLRKEQKQLLRSSRPVPPRLLPRFHAQDYFDAWQRALNEHDDSKSLKDFDVNESLVIAKSETGINRLLEETASLMEKKTGRAADLVSPFGSIEARIGIVLDHSPVSKAKNALISQVTSQRCHIV